MDGFLLVNKPQDMTSHDVVAKMRRLLKTKQVGHHGTLDPLATGLLVLGVNKGCKALKFINESDKTYYVTMKFGASYDTLDRTGTLIEKVDYRNDITVEDLNAYFNSIIGEQLQQVPMYSAVKVNGKKLYEYARQGIPVDRPIKKVTIKACDLIALNEDELIFSVTASKGFFVRVLCEDIGLHFHYPAHMTELRRDAADDFELKEAYTLEQVEQNIFEMMTLDDFAKKYFTVVNVETSAKMDILQGRPFNYLVGKNAYYCKDELIALDEYSASEHKTLRFRNE